jgi:uncharacterized protein (TIGR03083 family)
MERKGYTMPTEPPPGDALSARLEVLAASVDRLAALVRPLTPDQLRHPAYPSEWTIADVLSHLGSGAVITRLRLDGEVDMPAVWDEWNAKDPDAQAADALWADAELQGRLASLTPDEKTQLRFSMGPVELDLSTFLGMRLNEHVLHTWDVAVTFDPAAAIPTDEAELVVDTLGMITRFAGKPTGSDRTLTIRTVAPTRYFALALRPDGVSLSPEAPVDPPDLELPADAFIRLVYGRLDPTHAPSGLESAPDLGELRRVFPGF